ncbi:MAG TPA: CoA transferase [Terrimesophilobacter sp.]|nr:CoA transferase [Terrimesophilobacter sp.]
MNATLDGVRVVSLATNLPGPIAAARLTDLGASVTKIEPPGGDALAPASPRWYAELTSGQRVVTLDLKDATDRARLDEELDGADLLITAMRPSALARLGLANLATSYPRLCHVEIVGYDGDREELVGHDLNYQAAHGTLQPPALPIVPIADLLGAERVVSAALLLLLARQRDGAGGHQRVVLDEAARDAGAAIRHGLTGPGTVLGGGQPLYGIYESADGYVALGAIEKHFTARVREALGIEPTRAALKRAFAAHDTAYWTALAARLEFPLTPVFRQSPISS